MPISYLNNKRWDEISREERLFCAVLYEHARKNPAEFAEWVISTSKLEISSQGEWDLGYEVCFYRDYLKNNGESAREKNLPVKRTFDLCLFGEKAIIVIEAKVCEPFDARQNKDFNEDKTFLRETIGRNDLEIVVVPLASSTYFENAAKYGWEDTLTVFDHKKLTWKDVAEKYPDPILTRADRMYKK